MRGKKKLAVAMTAMWLAAVGGGIGAAGAQAQTEVLSGTTTTTGGFWSCSPGAWNVQRRSVSVGFKGAGTATGPYPGTFSDFGYASLHNGWAAMGTGYLSARFSITWGTTRITGTITRYPLLGGVYCGGFIAFGGGVNIGTYTATLSAPGKLQTISGAAAVSGDLYTGLGSQDSFTAALTLP